MEGNASSSFLCFPHMRCVVVYESDAGRVEWHLVEIALALQSTTYKLNIPIKVAAVAQFAFIIASLLI